jgi:hypothetical protein
MHNRAKGSASEKQRAVLRKILPNATEQEILDMSSHEADGHIAWHADNWRTLPPTQRQEAALRNCGLWREDLKRGEASDLIAINRAARMTPDEIRQEISRAQRSGRWQSPPSPPF